MQVYIEALEYKGYRVVACNAAEEALACVQREQPQLVILDLWLRSEVTGWQIYQELRSNPATATIPIIVSTAVEDSQLQVPAEVEEPDLTLLHKPFEIGDLLTLVKTVLTS